MAIRNLFLAGSIDLSQICSKLKIQHLNQDVQKFAKEGKNGHVYLSTVVSGKKEPSQWGQTHNLSLSQKGEQPVFIGDFRDFTRDNDGNNNNYQQQPQQQSYSKPQDQASNTRQNIDTDDLPF